MSAVPKGWHMASGKQSWKVNSWDFFLMSFWNQVINDTLALRIPFYDVWVDYRILRVEVYWNILWGTAIQKMLWRQGLCKQIRLCECKILYSPWSWKQPPNTWLSLYLEPCWSLLCIFKLSFCFNFRLNYSLVDFSLLGNNLINLRLWLCFLAIYLRMKY